MTWKCKPFIRAALILSKNVKTAAWHDDVLQARQCLICGVTHLIYYLSLEDLYRALTIKKWWADIAQYLMVPFQIRQENYSEFHQIVLMHVAASEATKWPLFHYKLAKPVFTLSASL